MPDDGAPWIWRSESAAARATRVLLAPATLAYRGVIGARNALFDRGHLSIQDPVIPALSVGNLTVGGTGKTPIAAWAARELRARGGSPAIVLRGYGEDESLVHARLNPGIPVIVGADRVRGVEDARRQGADVAVLDDAFQHRRIARVADWVVISADRWTGRQRLLPTGPWREPLSSVRRGSLGIVTRKAASRSDAAAVAAAVRSVAGGIPVAIAHLALGELRALADGAARPLESLAGARVLVMSAIGDPAALASQLAQSGASVRARRFRDHHAFTGADLADVARAAGDDIVVCTLKDAVKVGTRWPRGAPPIWYVSQRVSLEEGADPVARSLDAVLRARSVTSTSTGASRSSL